MSVHTEAITAGRLARWEKRLAEQHATPFLLLGVCHDHALGKKVLLVPEGVTNAMIRAVLEDVLIQLGENDQIF